MATCKLEPKEKRLDSCFRASIDFSKEGEGAIGKGRERLLPQLVAFMLPIECKGRLVRDQPYQFPKL